MILKTRRSLEKSEPRMLNTQVKHTSYIQYADAHNQKQPHVHETNKI